MAKKDAKNSFGEEALPHPYYSFQDLNKEDQLVLEEIIQDPACFEMVITTDLLPDGQYGKTHIVLCSEEILVIEKDTLSQKISVSSIAAVFCRDFVGNGVIEILTHEGEKIELARYSKTLSSSVQELAQHINRKLGLSEIDLSQKQEEAGSVSGPQEGSIIYRCSNCGHPLSHQGDACPKCASFRSMGKTIWKYLKPHVRLVLISLALSVVVTLCNLGPGYLVRQLVDGAIMAEGLDSAMKMQRLLIVVGIFFAFIGIRLIAQNLRIRASGALSLKIEKSLRMETYRALQRLSLSYYDSEHTGRIMARVLSDTQIVKQFIVNSIQNSIINVFMIFGIIAVLFAQDALLAAVALGPVPVVIFLGRYFSKRFKGIFKAARRKYASLSASVSEGISGVRVVKSFAQEEREFRSFASKNTEYYNANLLAVNTRAKFNPAVIFLMTLGTIIVWYIGGRQVISGVLTLGLLLQFITYMNQFYAPIQALIGLTESYQSSATAAERVFNIRAPLKTILPNRYKQIMGYDSI